MQTVVETLTYLKAASALFTEAERADIVSAIQWVFVPVNGDGNGIGSGTGSSGPGGGIYPMPPLTFGSLTKNWASPHPGESLRVQANWPVGSGAMLSGTYTFSARYLPPKISSEAERLLSEAGVVVPRQKVETPTQHYVKP